MVLLPEGYGGSQSIWDLIISRSDGIAHEIPSDLYPFPNPIIIHLLFPCHPLCAAHLPVAMSLWQFVSLKRHLSLPYPHRTNFDRSYRNLTPKTRLFIGVGIMAYAGFGLLASDQAEKSFGFTPTEQDRERLRTSVPKIRVVEKEG